VPNRSKFVRASYTFGGGDAPHERPPRRQMHDAGEVESRALGEDIVEWAGERREGVLTPAVSGSLAWASSFWGAAASTAMESGAVKESVPSVLHSCRMSTKNASKTQPLAVFSAIHLNRQQSLSPSAVGPPSTPRVRRLHSVQTSRLCGRGLSGAFHATHAAEGNQILQNKPSKFVE
jgi:hypothetical protein